MKVWGTAWGKWVISNEMGPGQAGQRRCASRNSKTAEENSLAELVGQRRAAVLVMISFCEQEVGVG